VSADDLPAAAQAAVRDWVRDAGGGLIALGGPASYGPGGYAGTAIEEALPVRCSRPRQLALLIALDASGSMAERVGGRAKIAFAREAVLRCASRLRETDRLAVIAFAAEPRPVLPLGAVPPPDRLARLLDAVEPHGPTDLKAALEAALEAMRASPAQVRHVILASDGQVTDEQAARLRAASIKRRFAAAGVTLSVLMTGREARAVALLRELASASFQLVERPADLPSAFLDELRKAAYGPFIREGRTEVRAVGPLEIASGVAPGVVRCYVRTVPKPSAVQEWATVDPPHPVLARWRFGLGRAVALATTVGTDWDEGLWGGDGAARLCRQAVRWAARPARTPGFEAEVVPRDGRLLLVVRAERDGRFLNGLELTARLAVPGEKALDAALEQTAPGEYRAWFPAPQRGVYHVVVGEAGGGQRVAVSGVVGCPAEWQAFGPDREALAAMARAGGGRVVPSLDALSGIEPREGRVRMDIEWVPLAAALVLFVLEVAVHVAGQRRSRL